MHLTVREARWGFRDNDVVENVPIFVENPETAPVTSHLGGFRALPGAWTIGWSR
jgi:hypothetical protein